MASLVLVHRPEPEPPYVVNLPQKRPIIGDEFLPGWTTSDYKLTRGNWNGEEYEYEVWVMPTSSDSR